MPQITDSVRQRIDAALPLQDDVVRSLTRAADSLTGSRRRELVRLSERIARLDHADGVARDARLLELFLPLTLAQPELARLDTPARQGEVERLVFRVLQRQAGQSRAAQERWSVIVYPLLVLLLSTLVLAFISIAITPVFEQMFSEFGLMLPATTRMVISISHALQSPWFWLLFAIVCLLTAMLLAVRAADRLRWLITGDADSRFSAGYSIRRSLGDLAWHTALLLELGQGVESSLKIAGAASRNAALRQESHNLARRLEAANSSGNPPQSLLVAPHHPTATNRIRGVPCHLLSHALTHRHDDIPRSAMLREIADLYWDREHTHAVWILSWVQPVATLIISLIVGLIVAALFMPLVELISGLT